LTDQGQDGTIWIAIRNDRRTGIMIRRKDEMEPVTRHELQKGMGDVTFHTFMTKEEAYGSGPLPVLCLSRVHPLGYMSIMGSLKGIIF
jgi:hypothetical protein